MPFNIFLIVLYAIDTGSFSSASRIPSKTYIYYLDRGKVVFINVTEAGFYQVVERDERDSEGNRIGVGRHLEKREEIQIQSNFVIDFGSMHFIQTLEFDFEVTNHSRPNMEAKFTYDSPRNEPVSVHAVDASSATYSRFACNSITRFVAMNSSGVAVLKSFRALGHGTYAELFAGCYKYALQGFSQMPDINTCLLGCYNNRNVYAGVKTELNEVYCKCLNNANYTLIDVKYCRIFCKYGQICGSKDDFSIYFTDYRQLDKEINASCVMRQDHCKHCKHGQSGLACLRRECSKNNGGCGSANCVRLNEGFILGGICNCSMEGLTDECPDKDECSKSKPCPTGPCIRKGKSRKCKCSIGYVHTPSGACVDVDECLTNVQSCDLKSTRCSNMPGSYYCHCLKGFGYYNKTSCSDFDECSSIHLCHGETTYCTNTMGDYDCKCMIGYSKESKYKCTDIDECLTQSHTCESSSPCKNTAGSFMCVCEEGTIKRDFNYLSTCEDIDECLNYTACERYVSICINLRGTYSCHCVNGFRNIDENNCVVDTSGNITHTLPEEYSTTTINTLLDVFVDVTTMHGQKALLVVALVISTFLATTGLVIMAEKLKNKSHANHSEELPEPADF